MGEVVCPQEFEYVNKWSDIETWGGNSDTGTRGSDYPVEGDSLWIPKGTKLFVDVPNPPKLKEVVVEGELIFDPSDTDCPDEGRTFDAHYLFTRGGKIQAGTEAENMKCCLTITLHGQPDDAEVPIYGNKVLGVRYGTLDLHGPAKGPTWVDLENTALAGANIITVKGPIQWSVND